MTKEREYVGIDVFRIISALLVIAIHTSPLDSISLNANFVFTHVAARVAVPFFFMTTGFFLFRDGADSVRLRRFVKKTAVIYAVSILIYIPVNIYNGYFSSDGLILKILKDIVFDGTLYHLWYLPASITGALIVFWLLKRFKLKLTVTIAVVLYTVGLLGDSYFGFTRRISALRDIYYFMFNIFDFTRNGLFFAPIFLVFGAAMALCKINFSLKTEILGFAASFLLMLAEGTAIHYISPGMHDSMYIMLLPCMFFLFRLILRWKGRGKNSIGEIALLMYIVHPMIIIIIRMAADFLGIKEFITGKSILFYIAVVLVSAIVSAAIFIVKESVKRIYINRITLLKTSRAWAEIDLNSLKHNVDVLKSAIPEKCELMAVVKADAYGHGAVRLSKALNSYGVTAFAVATLEEGIKLRKHGVYGDILILGHTEAALCRRIIRYDMTQTVGSAEYADELNKSISGVRKVKIHIKINTGMQRLGIDSCDVETVADIFDMKKLNVTGIYTHLCVADSFDERDKSFTEKQISEFYELIEKLRERNIKIPKIHIQNSGGLLNYPELQCDYTRIGLALYGAVGNKNRLKLSLEPVLSLKARVELVRNVDENVTVGYGRRFKSAEKSKIAVISIGYADGVPRSLSCGKGCVLIRGRRAPVVGNICMDQMMVNITNIPGIKIGDTAVIIGKSLNDLISLEEIAEKAGSIPNEILSRIGGRINKLFK